MANATYTVEPMNLEATLERIDVARETAAPADGWSDETADLYADYVGDWEIAV
jgi:hypothetical protein